MKHKGEIKYLSIGIFQYHGPGYNYLIFMENTQLEIPAKVCTIEAPCKINLHLSIGEKRPDGFHNLESIFASLALSDSLRFECTGKKADCHLFTEWDLPAHERPERQIPPEDNLVFKAVSLFREQSGFKKGLKIRLIKRIPVGAGLGGGSSDAASALLALNSLAGAAEGGNEPALSMENLKEMAAILGSDVPFFLKGGAAYVSGRGEQVELVKIPEGLWVILVKPRFSSDTKSAFRLLDKAREAGIEDKPQLRTEGRTQRNTEENHQKKLLINALNNNPQTWPFYNDFLAVLEPKSDYLAILENLRKTGASFTGLSGAGSCCFGIFSSKKEARKAEKELLKKEIFTRLTFFLAQNAKPVLEY